MISSPLPDFTRRLFLSRTLQLLGTTAALPLASTCLADSQAEESGVPALEFLHVVEHATLEALADTFIPAGGAFETGARDVGLASRIDHYLPRIDPAVATGFRGALAFVETEAPMLAGKKAPFSSLSPDDREAVLTAMLETSGLPRNIFVAAKHFCLVHFYTIPDTWQFTGYDGPMLTGDA
jgi:hypothetical protein